MRLCLFLASSPMAAACSSGASPASPTPAPPPTATPAPAPAPAGPPTITITAAGMSPLEITIAVGQRVTFFNNDTRPHDVVGGDRSQQSGLP